MFQTQIPTTKTSLRNHVRVTLVPYGVTKRSCYVIAACSEKERPDSFNHSKKVHLNLLQISPRSAQYNGQKGARQPRLTSPLLRKTARFLHAVGASTRMRRAPRQHALAVGETAPAFPTATPLHNLPSNGSQRRSASARGDSRVAER